MVNGGARQAPTNVIIHGYWYMYTRACSSHENHYFYPSTSSAPGVRADSSSWRDASSLWSQNHDTAEALTVHCNAVRRVGAVTVLDTTGTTYTLQQPRCKSYAYQPGRFCIVKIEITVGRTETYCQVRMLVIAISEQHPVFF